MLTVIKSMFIVASISVLWRSTLNKKHHWREGIQKTFPTFLGTALTCGLCFTYWVTCFFVVFYHPLPYNFFEFNISSSFTTSYLSYLFLSWMFIGIGALFIRFLFALLQESVNRMNEINGHGHHGHHDHAH